MRNDAIAIDAIIGALAQALGQHEVATGQLSDADQRNALVIARNANILSLVGPALAKASRYEDLIVSYAAGAISTNSDLLRAGAEVMAALAQNQIDATIIKGPLQQYLLHKTFYSRPSGDLDVVVPPADFARASAVLVRHGFARATPSLWWRSALGDEHYERLEPFRAAVDLHHRIGQPGTAGSLPASAVIGNSIIVPVDNTILPAAGREIALLICAISTAKALYNREPSAVHLADLFAGVIADFPRAVGSLLDLGRRFRLQGVCGAALRLVDVVFGPLEMPGEVGMRFRELPREQLLGMIFCPAASETRWPRRRELVWEFSDRRLGTFANEWLVIGRSEVSRRLFERAGARAMHRI